MSVELANSLGVFELLSSHSPNISIVYIKWKLNISAICGVSYITVSYETRIIYYKQFVHQFSSRGRKYSYAGNCVSEF